MSDAIFKTIDTPQEAKDIANRLYNLALAACQDDMPQDLPDREEVMDRNARAHAATWVLSAEPTPDYGVALGSLSQIVAQVIASNYCCPVHAAMEMQALNNAASAMVGRFIKAINPDQALACVMPEGQA